MICAVPVENICRAAIEFRAYSDSTFRPQWCLIDDPIIMEFDWVDCSGTKRGWPRLYQQVDVRWTAPTAEQVRKRNALLSFLSEIEKVGWGRAPGQVDVMEALAVSSRILRTSGIQTLVDVDLGARLYPTNAFERGVAEAILSEISTALDTPLAVKAWSWALGRADLRGFVDSPATFSDLPMIKSIVISYDRTTRLNLPIAGKTKEPIQFVGVLEKVEYTANAYGTGMRYSFRDDVGRRFVEFGQKHDLEEGRRYWVQGKLRKLATSLDGPYHIIKRTRALAVV